jgi:hypothetical protein
MIGVRCVVPAWRPQRCRVENFATEQGPERGSAVLRHYVLVRHVGGSGRGPLLGGGTIASGRASRSALVAPDIGTTGGRTVERSTGRSR